MANSITLSQSLVDDISQKIQDGTATAEQVVLYTKGLQQLQGGNDFQAVIIGLSQSAVDAIDSSNAQFQEDSQAAIDAITTIFNTTATDIDASADNAVAAINNAKDTLNASSVNLETTISGLPSLTQIREGVYNDSNYVHPYDRPAFVIMNDDISSSNEGVEVHWYNHRGERISPDGITYRKHIYFNSGYHMSSASRRVVGDNSEGIWNINSGEITPFQSHTNSTSSTGYSPYFTQSHNKYGHRMGHFNDYNTNWNGYASAWNADWSRDTACVVGDPDFTWGLLRLNDKIYVGGMFNPCLSMVEAYATRGYFREGNANSTTLLNGEDHWDKPGQWKYSHEYMQITGIGTGYGNMGYNQNTKKLIIMVSDGNYNQRPQQYTLTSDYDLKQIAKGEIQVGYNYDLVGNLKINLEIDGSVDNSTNRPAPSISETNYRGVVVPCDNGNVVHHVQLGNVSGGAFTTRWTLNGAGDDLIYDTNFNFTGQTTSYGYEQGSEYGVRHNVTNDGKYVIAYSPYYYYSGGMKASIIRVSDGKVVMMQMNETSWGFNLVPFQRNKFIVGIVAYPANNHKWIVDCDQIMDTHADGTMVNPYLTSGSWELLGSFLPGPLTSYNATFHNIYKKYGYEIGYMNENDIDTRTL